MLTHEFKPKLKEVNGLTFGVPEITRVSLTDNTLDAWLTSKPNIQYTDENQALEAVNKLVSNNLPISGFKVYCLRFYTSIYFRDLLFCMPNIVPWSQSTRNLEMTSEIYQISIEDADTEGAKGAILGLEQCRKRSANGEALDLIKKDLPVSTMMEYTLFIDRRTLITFVKTLQDLDQELYDLYGVLLLNAADITEEDYQSTKVFGVYDKLSFTEEMINQVGVNLTESKSVTIPVLDAYMLHILNIDFGIAAQFIRQHFSQRRYYEFNRIKSLGYKNALAGVTLRDKTKVAVMGDFTSFNRMISRRLCYFAAWDKADHNDDSWALILDNYIKDTTDEQFDSILPCKGCGSKCDIIDEFKLRTLKEGDENLKQGLTAADRNGICPYLVDILNSKNTAKEILIKRRETQGSNSETYNRWFNRFNNEG